MNRVMITGLGAITASGETVDAMWTSLLAGKSALTNISHWDLSSWACQKAGEIQSFEPAKLLPDRKLMKVISKQDVFGLHAAMQAVLDSDMLSYRETLSFDETVNFNEQTGIYVGSPGNKYFQQYDFLPLLQKSKGDMGLFADELFNEVHPMWLLRILPNNVLAYTGITYGFKGVNHNVTNHAVSGTQALIEAYHAIRIGQAERVVVVAYDIGHEPQALYYYNKLGVISASDLKPFDKAHDGTILGEGAAALILESEASVKARNARVYAEVVGGASSTEMSGLFSVEPDGQKLSALMAASLQDIAPQEVGLVVAHGNGNPPSDLSEARAIEMLFNDVPVTAFKWAMGHTLCASGLIDTVLSVCSLQNQCAPGIANLTQAVSPINVSAVTRPLDKEKPYVMMVNRGFGSLNATLVMKRCE